MLYFISELLVLKVTSVHALIYHNKTPKPKKTFSANDINEEALSRSVKKCLFSALNPVN